MDKMNMTFLYVNIQTIWHIADFLTYNNCLGNSLFQVSFIFLKFEVIEVWITD